MVKNAIRWGADIHARDKEAKTPLFYAARHNNLEMVKFLVEKGANVDMNRALVTAEERNNFEMIKFLREKMAK